MAKRVLIVEDEQDVAQLIAGVLDLEGYDADLAMGEDAMDQALRFQPDVVLLDLMMPVVDGYEVARRMRSNPATRDLPIIVMTAMHDAATRASEVGAEQYVAKPFDIDDLLQCIEQVVGG